MRDNFYTYCLLKYKHSPFLDESINLGVLIYFNESQNFSFKYSKNLSRINKIYNNVPEKTIKEYLRQINNRFKKYESFNEIIFPLNDSNLQEFLSYNILPRDASVLQFTNFKTNQQDFADNFIEQIIFEQYFIEDIKSSLTISKDPIVLDRLYKALEKDGFSKFANPNRVQKNWEFPTENGKFNFDFAWKNGVWNLVKPVSFDLTTSERIISKARNNLGEFTDLYSEIDIEKYTGNIIVAKPTSKSLFTTYDKAVKILRKSNARVIEEANKKEFSNYKEDILKAVSISDM